MAYDHHKSLPCVDVLQAPCGFWFVKVMVSNRKHDVYIYIYIYTVYFQFFSRMEIFKKTFDASQIFVKQKVAKIKPRTADIW